MFAPLLAAVAQAGELGDYLPREPLTTARAVELLAADRIGPPATRYDEQTTSPGAATTAEQAVERALDLGPLTPCDAHRRFNRLLLSLRLAGTPQTPHLWFLAEHVGMAGVPDEIVEFVVPSGDPEAAAEQVRASILQARRDPDVRSVAVTLADDPAHPGMWVGIVTVFVATARFEPFPRTLAPGQVAVVPGTLLDDRERYGLYVTFPGREVREFPLAGAGAFDIEVPTPTEPGPYRVAMSRIRKRSMPDDPFFFTLYVGVQPPLTFEPQDWGDSGVTTGDPDIVEQQFVDALDAGRAAAGVPELDPIDGSAALRALLAGVPDGSERKRIRYLTQALERDPLPGVPHGAVQAVFGSGYSGGEAAWEVLEHPISRGSVLDPEFTVVAVGAVSRPGGLATDVLAVLTVPATPAASSRQRVWEALAARWTGGPPSAAPNLEAALDGLADQLASGKLSFDAISGKIKSIAKKVGMTQGYGVWAYQVATGDLPDISKVSIDPRMRVLAIGDAHGTSTGGVGTTVLVVVVAPQAQ